MGPTTIPREAAGTLTACREALFSHLLQIKGSKYNYFEELNK